MTLIARLLTSEGVDHTVEEVAPLGPIIRVEPDQAGPALAALKNCDHEFSFLVDLFGVDTGEAIDVVYHLRSFARDEEVIIKSAHAYGSTLASVWTLYLGALMPERECAEMFGLKLSGHPNPKHLLLTEKVPPLLLKSVEIRSAEEVRNR